MMIFTNYAVSVSLIFAAISDIRCRRVPNILTLPILALSLVNTLVSHGISGVTLASVQIVLIFIAGFILNKIGLVGGGDIKLLMIMGSLGNPILLCEFLKYSIYACGFVASIILLLNDHLLTTIKAFYLAFITGTIGPLKVISGTSMPMAVPICLGGLWVLWF